MKTLKQFITEKILINKNTKIKNMPINKFLLFIDNSDNSYLLDRNRFLSNIEQYTELLCFVDNKNTLDKLNSEQNDIIDSCDEEVCQKIEQLIYKKKYNTFKISSDVYINYFESSSGMMYAILYRINIGEIFMTFSKNNFQINTNENLISEKILIHKNSKFKNSILMEFKIIIGETILNNHSNDFIELFNEIQQFKSFECFISDKTIYDDLLSNERKQYVKLESKSECEKIDKIFRNNSVTDYDYTDCYLCYIFDEDENIMYLGFADMTHYDYGIHFYFKFKK